MELDLGIHIVMHSVLSLKPGVTGVFIKHPPENLMASFDFTSAVLDEGTTFIFGS
jgi:hypothetical protein